jgi:hypothetical protein
MLSLCKLTTSFYSFSKPTSIQFKSPHNTRSNHVSESFRLLSEQLANNLLNSSFYSQKNSENTDFLKQTFEKAKAIYPFEDEKDEIKESVNKSICKTMHEIMNRTLNSQKGVMTEQSFYHEVVSQKSSYLYYTMHRLLNMQNVQFEFFTYGENVKHLVAKKDVPASIALESFFEGPMPADGGMTVEAVYQKAVMEFIGKEAFNRFYSAPNRRFEIRNCVCPNFNSSLDYFIELADPDLLEETDQTALQIGDHIGIVGVPWFSIKHPLSPMNNLHGIVMGFDKQKRPLIGALEIQNVRRIDQLMMDLVDAYNQPQTPEEKEFINKIGLENYLLEEFAEERIMNLPLAARMVKPMDVLGRYSINDVKSYGGCKIYNQHTCHLSTFVLGSLKSFSGSSEQMNQRAFQGKAITLARQISALLLREM